MEFKVVIAGGRDFQDYERLSKTCDKLFSNKRPTCIISGGARGADSLGQRYAQDRAIFLQVMPANWSLFGKQAGYVRNRQMLKEADAVVAFWDGKSRGTAHMIAITREARKPLRIIRYQTEV